MSEVTAGDPYDRLWGLYAERDQARSLAALADLAREIEEETEKVAKVLYRRAAHKAEQSVTIESLRDLERSGAITPTKRN